MVVDDAAGAAAAAADGSADAATDDANNDDGNDWVPLAPVACVFSANCALHWALAATGGATVAASLPKKSSDTGADDEAKVIGLDATLLDELDATSADLTC